MPPVFARAVVQNEDCHAVALAKADTFNLATSMILQSERDEDGFYIGSTDDLRKRLRNHNAGRVLHTAKWRPWRLKAYVALSDRVRAAAFERYLKSASGRAFIKKHL